MAAVAWIASGSVLYRISPSLGTFYIIDDWNIKMKIKARRLWDIVSRAAIRVYKRYDMVLFGNRLTHIRQENMPRPNIRVNCMPVSHRSLCNVVARIEVIVTEETRLILHRM